MKNTDNADNHAYDITANCTSDLLLYMHQFLTSSSKLSLYIQNYIIFVKTKYIYMPYQIIHHCKGVGISPAICTQKYIDIIGTSFPVLHLNLCQDLQINRGVVIGKIVVIGLWSAGSEHMYIYMEIFIERYIYIKIHL
jgi:hypothetical protein